MKVLIIGGGIAGLTTALQLLNRNISFTLIDHGVNNSTLPATGIINPIVFRRTTKSWRVDQFLPSLIEFYSKLEKETKQSFFYPLKLRRIFSSNQEKEEWIKKQTCEEFKPYLEKINSKDDSYNLVKSPFGTARVKQCYWVNSEVFMSSCQKYLSANKKIIEEKFDFEKYNPTLKIYKHIYYDKVIFCEGSDVQHNPLFNYLNVKPTKGQILTLSVDAIPEEELLNRKCFVLPIGNGYFKVGSTYEWDAADALPTKDGKQKILDNLHVLTTTPPKIIAHSAGIRPTTYDRRPFIGEHQKFKDNFIFNGLGTKGYMIAPLLSKELTEHIFQGVPLHKEVLIDRIKIDW
ncbi:MAG: FAD-binding oxidoreductase [Bacteroidetes bacterium]|nr:FAD-binding oxidoreductase [Bacteroidota bacterium]